MLDSQEKNELYLSGQNALIEGNTYKATRAFIDLGNKELIKKVGDSALLEGSFYDAQLAFNFLGDRKRMLKIIKKVVDPEFVLGDYVGNKLINQICANFQSWILRKGFLEGGAFWPCESINIAYNLVENYDIGIGIAHGGLFFGWLFELFGLQVKIVDFHRKNKDDTLKWIDSINSEMLAGKNIIVFDNDVRTGRTTRRVLRELKQYKPKGVKNVKNSCDN